MNYIEYEYKFNRFLLQLMLQFAIYRYESAQEFDCDTHLNETALGFNEVLRPMRCL